jgi:fatty acid desaturase
MEPVYEDIQLKEILLKSRKEMPFNDFEDELMIEIYKERDRKRYVLKNIKLSWMFFIIGMISGIALISIPSFLNETAADFTSYVAILSILMIALCLIILLFAEKLIRFSFFRER